MIGGLIGVVHLQAVPGDPGYTGTLGFPGVYQAAVQDAEALIKGGVDALLIENFGSAPFRKGTAGDRIEPHQVAALTLVARQCKSRFSVPVGINCLRNDVISALGIAAASGSDFVRVNIHTGAYMTDQGLIEGEAHVSLRYRQLLGAQHIAILADVLVKHASPIAPLSPTTATNDCLQRGHASGVIVTGSATGAAVDVETLEEVHNAAKPRPVYIGSGLTPDNAMELAPYACGAIVGTWVKQDGQVGNPVDSARVARLAKIVKGGFAPLR